MKLDYALTFGQLGPGNDVFLHSLVLDWQLSHRWQYVLQADYGTDCGHSADVRQDYGMNQYLFYRLNACWKLGTRVEWLRAEDPSYPYLRHRRIRNPHGPDIRRQLLAL